MKVIGKVEPEYDDIGQIKDVTYLDGSIVVLSQQEFSLLIMLQDAWDGGCFGWPPTGNERLSDDINMNSAFKAIHIYVKAKFALNEFKVAIDHLDNILKEKKAA